MRRTRLLARERQLADRRRHLVERVQFSDRVRAL